jgi:hypothetical protein
MGRDVLFYHVLLVHGITVLIVFHLILGITVCLGNYGMVTAVYTTKIHVLQELHGTVICVPQIQQVVQMDATWMAANARFFPKDVLLRQLGTMVNVIHLLVHVHLVQCHQVVIVYQLHNAQMDKTGIPTVYNVCVQRGLGGVENSVWFVQEGRFGIYGKDVCVRLGCLWRDRSVSNQLIVCVLSFLTLFGMMERKCVSVHLDIQLLDTNVFVMVYSFPNYVIVVLIELIQNITTVFAGVTVDILSLVHNVCLTTIMEMISQVIVGFLLSSIYNKKDVYPVLKGVFIAKTVILV